MKHKSVKNKSNFESIWTKNVSLSIKILKYMEQLHIMNMIREEESGVRGMQSTSAIA